MSNAPSFYVINQRRRGLTAEECLLRKVGDWKSYIELMDSGAIDAPQFFREMMNYYATGIKSFGNIAPEKGGLLVATSVWGNDYLARFLTLCVPSLLERRNLRALKDSNARLFIHTNADGRDLISNHPAVANLINSGVQVQVMMLSDAVLEMMNASPNFKYWHLGMIQSVHLQYAKALGVGFHLMMPDFVYSSGYFERLLRLGARHPIITHGCLSASQDTISFDEYRDDMAIDIIAPRLEALALIHEHPRSNMHFVRKSKKIPRTHVLIIEGRNEVHIMSPHQTIAYMSKEMIAGIPDRIFFTLDSELEKIAKDTPIYTPSAGDALVAVEVSGKAEIYGRKEENSAADYCVAFRSRIPEKELYPLFLQEMAFPVDRSMLGDRWFMDNEDILVMKSQIKEALWHDAQK